MISSIGSRGDVQPILALALELRALGHEPRLCVAPNFKDWIESFGLACIPIGPDLKKFARASAPGKLIKPSAAQLRSLAAGTVREQFQVLTDATRGCHLIVAAGALQIAARSIAEALEIPYVFAAYCPVTLPSPDHPPPKMGTHYPQSLPATFNRLLWSTDRRHWNVMFRATLNGERVKAGLAPINDVRPHIFTDRPWLAADPLIAPGRSMDGLQIMQTGAWMLPDRTPLPDDLERFLASGEPPVYFGFGSMRATGQTARSWLEAARSLGLRSIISQGWADFGAVDAGTDCIVIEEANHEKLFPRVAAVIHHGGAGTTTASVRAGRAQVIIPHLYDQYYWARRVRKLGVGVAGPTRERMTAAAVAAALRKCLRPEMTARALNLASRIELQGARNAASRLVHEFGCCRVANNSIPLQRTPN